MPSAPLTLTLTGLRPSPTRHDVCNCRFKGKLTQGPAVCVADRHHSLRRGIMTMTRMCRSGALSLRCGASAINAIWETPVTTGRRIGEVLHLRWDCLRRTSAYSRLRVAT
jgi:hypothetical protein